MKLRILTVLIAVLLAVPALRAQERPATREEVVKLLDVMQTRETQREMLRSMTSQMRALSPNRSRNAPNEVSTRFDALLDEMMETLPLDEMVEDMIPIYQKHFNSADVSAMITFYSTPVGQKVLREMPAIMTESMVASQPRMQAHMATFAQKLQEAVREMMEQLPGQPPATY